MFTEDKLRGVMQRWGREGRWFNQEEGRRERVHRERSLRKAEEGQVRFLLRERVCVRARASCSVVSDPLWLHGLVCQVPLSMEFSTQEYWGGLPFPSPRELAEPGTEPASLASPLLAGRFLTMWATREARGNISQQLLPNDSVLS